MGNSRLAPRWMSVVLWLAAAYNLAWGAWMVLFPGSFFDLLSLPRPNYPPLWQCIGMMVGVYGVGYGLAALAPLRHWPLVLVGLLGKICGPLGFVRAALNGELPWRFGCTILANDVIWWVPFVLILAAAYRQANGSTATIR